MVAERRPARLLARLLDCGVLGAALAELEQSGAGCALFVGERGHCGDRLPHRDGRGLRDEDRLGGGRDQDGRGGRGALGGLVAGRVHGRGRGAWDGEWRMAETKLALSSLVSSRNLRLLGCFYCDQPQSMQGTENQVRLTTKLCKKKMTRAGPQKKTNEFATFCYLGNWNWNRAKTPGRAKHAVSQARDATRPDAGSCSPLLREALGC